MYVEVCINIWQIYPPLTRRHIFVRLQRSFWHLSYIGSTLTYNCFQIKNKLIWLHILCSAFLFNLKCVCVFCSFFIYFILYHTNEPLNHSYIVYIRRTFLSTCRAYSHTACVVLFHFFRCLLHFLAARFSYFMAWHSAHLNMCIYVYT